MGCLSYLLGSFLLFLLTCYAVATSTSVWRRLAKTTCRYTVDRYPFTRPSFYIVFCVCRIVSYYAHSKTCKQSLAPREMASSHRYLISEPTLITSLPFINNIKEAFESPGFPTFLLFLSTEPITFFFVVWRSDGFVDWPRYVFGETFRDR